jgi:16S rRNA (uracil1498-N3)-methyltransferase
LSRGLRCFYVDSVFPAENATLRLSSRETFHLHRVLRLKAGDACQIFNRNGWGAEALVETISQAEGAQVRLKKIFPVKEKTLLLKVAQALPQKRKMDDLVRQAEELGVHEFWILETERTVVKMSAEAGERARGRWERIVIEAAKQSGNPILMQVGGPFSFEKVLEEKRKRSEPSYLFHPDPSGLAFPSLVEGLRRSKSREAPASAFLFFGPEGGFTEEEVRRAESVGVQKVFLGDSTLRIDTAFLGVLSALRWMLS